MRLRSFASLLPILRLSGLVLFIILLPGCAGMTAEEQQAKRAELDEMGEITVTKLLELHPDAEEALSDSVGYTVIDMKVTKVPVLGGGSGLAVTVLIQNLNEILSSLICFGRCYF